MWQYQCSDVAISVLMITLERQLIIKNVNVIGVLLDFILLKPLIPLSILSHYVIRGNIHHWIHNYFSSR